VGENQLYPAKPAYISTYNKEATTAFPLRKVATSMVESIKGEIMLRDRLELEVDEELMEEQEEDRQQPNLEIELHNTLAVNHMNTTGENEEEEEEEDTISERCNSGENSNTADDSDDDYKPNR
jgi:hypothetical protein